MFESTVALKLDLLNKGISFSPDFLDYYQHQEELIEKRRAYGTGDSSVLGKSVKVPQEIFLGEGVISAVNHQPSSPWRIELAEGAPVIRGRHSTFPVSFPQRPKSYGKKLSNQELFEQTVTVYGDTTLGVFSPGHCYYFNDGRECKFCSLGPARENLSDHRMKIKSTLASEAINLATELEPGRYKRVLVNGGTIPNYDKGFSIHMDLIQGIRESANSAALEYHLISMPPKNFQLFERFKATGNKLAMSLEIFDPDEFAKTCPGKAQDYTRPRFLEAFSAAVETIGHGNVYVGFVAGMEPLSSLLEGIEYFGRLGVVPAVAVFHPDAGSKYEHWPRPSVDYLNAVGKKMAEVYQREKFTPLIEGSGRNSLDTEAYRGGF
ncbi:MAG: biotin synthase [Pseudomonas sp.]